MENKQITHGQVESQGRELRLPRKLPLLLIQIKWTLLPILCIATFIISDTSTNDLLPKIIHSVKKKKGRKKMCAYLIYPRPRAGTEMH